MKDHTDTKESQWNGSRAASPELPIRRQPAGGRARALHLHGPPALPHDDPGGGLRHEAGWKASSCFKYASKRGSRTASVGTISRASSPGRPIKVTARGFLDMPALGALRSRESVSQAAANGTLGGALRRLRGPVVAAVQDKGARLDASRFPSGQRDDDSSSPANVRRNARAVQVADMSARSTMGDRGAGTIEWRRREPRMMRVAFVDRRFPAPDGSRMSRATRRAAVVGAIARLGGRPDTGTSSICAHTPAASSAVTCPIATTCPQCDVTPRARVHSRRDAGAKGPPRVPKEEEDRRRTRQ